MKKIYLILLLIIILCQIATPQSLDRKTRFMNKCQTEMESFETEINKWERERTNLLILVLAITILGGLSSLFAFLSNIERKKISFYFKISIFIIGVSISVITVIQTNLFNADLKTYCKWIRTGYDKKKSMKSLQKSISEETEEITDSKFVNYENEYRQIKNEFDNIIKISFSIIKEENQPLFKGSYLYAQTTEKLPDWINKKYPVEDDKFVYYLGKGENEDLGKAKEIAINSAVKDLKMKAIISEKNKDSSTDIYNSMMEGAYQIEKTYFEKKSGNFIYYILIKINKGIQKDNLDFYINKYQPEYIIKEPEVLKKEIDSYYKNQSLNNKK